MVQGFRVVYGCRGVALNASFLSLFAICYPLSATQPLPSEPLIGRIRALFSGPGPDQLFLE